MEDHTPESKDDGRLQPRKRFYMTLAVINDDGTVNPEEAIVGNYDDLDLAVDQSRLHVEEEGEEVYVYECRPVRRILRGKIRVLPLMRPAK